jgi:hypothetical protein
MNTLHKQRRAQREAGMWQIQPDYRTTDAFFVGLCPECGMNTLNIDPSNPKCLNPHCQEMATGRTW